MHAQSKLIKQDDLLILRAIKEEKYMQIQDMSQFDVLRDSTIFSHAV